MASGVIVLAEDDASLRKLYTDVLSAQGYTVMAAVDGEEAVNLLQKVRPKLVILDIMMPRLNGIETSRQARKIMVDDVPILFLTALDRVEMLHQCLQAGGDDYLIKSADIATLIERVNYWVTQPPGARKEHRRHSALAEVESRLARAEENGVANAALSSDNDVTVREMSSLVDRAKKHASADFGSTIREKLYLLGFVVGITECWAQAHRTVSLRFDVYLSAVLRETGILSAEEIRQMIASLGELSTNECFTEARGKGQRDGSEARRRGANHVPMSLAEFASGLTPTNGSHLLG